MHFNILCSSNWNLRASLDFAGTGGLKARSPAKVAVKFVHKVLLVILMAAPGNSPALPLDDLSCLGPESAANAAVFFHGRQAATGADNLEEIDLLRSISARVNLRIAVVAARHRDIDGKLYWSREDLSQMALDFDEAQAVASRCIGAREHGILAFSSGGYFINQLFDAGILSGQKWIVTIGAGGEIPTIDSLLPFYSNIDQALSPTLHMLMGLDEGRYFDEAAAYAEYIQNRHRSVKFHPFPGGHVIPVEQASELLLSIFSPSQ